MSVDADLLKMLQDDNKRMRAAGTALAEAALHVIREYDGCHRLSLAVAEWAKALANEGGRENRHASVSTPTGEGEADPGRILKDALFACLKAGCEKHTYGGVLVAKDRYAWLRLTVEPPREPGASTDAPAHPQQGGERDASNREVQS